MKVIKKILPIIFILSLLTTAFAAANNSITIYKLTNKNNQKPNFTYDMKEGISQELIRSHELVPIADAEISIFKVDDRSLEYYDNLNFDKLKETQKYITTVNTDKDGKAYINQLEDGIYYIRDISKDNRASSVILKLPYLDEKNDLIRDVFIYLKSSLDDKPPTPPDNPPNPPGRHFLKVDNTEKRNPLKGAYFKVVKKVGDKFEPVIKNNKEYVVSSDKDGYVFVGDIDFGTYYLIETMTPEIAGVKYKPLTEPVKFEINSLSRGDSPIVIENVPATPPIPPTPPDTPPDNPPNTPPDTPTVPPNTPPDNPPPTNPGIKIPKTGDIESFFYVIGGAIFFLVGLYGYEKSKKREKSVS